MKKLILAATAIAAMTASAEAVSRYNSMNHSCGKAQSLVAREGAVIFRYPSRSNPSLTLYDRFVRHGGYCAHAQEAAPMAIPTADRRSCPLLHCRQSTHDDDFWPGN